MSRARRRSMYCTPAEWAEIAERAEEADMSISGFLISAAFITVLSARWVYLSVVSGFR